MVSDSESYSKTNNRRIHVSYRICRIRSRKHSVSSLFHFYGKSVIRRGIAGFLSLFRPRVFSWFKRHAKNLSHNFRKRNIGIYISKSFILFICNEYIYIWEYIYIYIYIFKNLNKVIRKFEFWNLKYSSCLRDIFALLYKLYFELILK